MQALRTWSKLLGHLSAKAPSSSSETFRLYMKHPAIKDCEKTTGLRITFNDNPCRLNEHNLRLFINPQNKTKKKGMYCFCKHDDLFS